MRDCVEIVSNVPKPGQTRTNQQEIRFSGLVANQAMLLSPEQKRIVKGHAGPLFPNPTPRWSDTGDDAREQLRGRLIARLQGTQNTGIAEIITRHPQQCWAILQEKSKSMRYTQRKSTTPTQASQSRYCVKMGD